MTAVWKRYLLAGLVASAICVALPRGVGRDIVYCLIGASGAAAILAGVRRNRPAHPAAWYLFAAGTATWTMADALYGWYEHVALIEPFPSLADALYLAVYPLFAAGLLVLGRRHGSARGPTGIEETAILTVGLALVTWVFLVAPTWFSYDEPLVNRLVGAAYPFCDVVLCAMLMRVTTSSQMRNRAFLLLAGSVGAMLVADGVFLVGALVPAIADKSSLLDFGWLLSYVLWGAAALHPSMPALTSPQPRRVLRTSTTRLLTLVAAVAIGPAVLVGEMITGRQLDVGAVVLSAVVTMGLAFTRIHRLLRLMENQTEQLGRLADTDYVTGLTTSRRFTEQLGDFLADAHGRVAGFLIINVEGFAEIHDTLGQQTGDAILHAVGVRLSEVTVRGALVARMGGNTFGVLDPSITSGAQACLAATRIRQALERPLNLPDLSVSVEVSLGAVVLPEDGAEPRLALLRADVALSVARARSERTARYGIEMESGEALAPLVIGELREAIEHGEIVVHYQPQVDLRSGLVSGVEALVRWQHPRHGLLNPGTFIPSAEQTGLIGPLMRHVLDSALRQCACWRLEGLNLTVAVNLSVRNLLDPGLVEHVSTALHRHGLEPGCLELEITESSAMVDTRRSIAVLGALAELGIGMSIDDYGTGHSSLAYLQKLPIRRLKIDRSFVTGMIDDPASTAIVASTIKLARVLQFDVVAEGIEDDATLLRLRDMKCSTAQGFALGPPVTALLLPELVRHIEERLSALLGVGTAAQLR